MFGNYAPYMNNYSANPVSSGAPYTYGAGGSAFPGGAEPRGGAAPDMNPASGGGEPAGAGGGGGGMGAGGWMALFQMIGDKLEGRRAAQAAAAAAQADIPEDPKWMTPFLHDMAVEGKQLKDSKLGARPMAEANALGHDVAVSRGLSGPLAAAVQTSSVNNAQGAYDKWRQGALMSHRQAYMDRVRQYMQAIQQYRSKKRAAGYAEREATIARMPIGPIGGALYRMGLDNGMVLPGTGQGNTTQGIEQNSAYSPAPIYSY